MITHMRWRYDFAMRHRPAIDWTGIDDVTLHSHCDFGLNGIASGLYGNRRRTAKAIFRSYSFRSYRRYYCISELDVLVSCGYSGSTDVFREIQLYNIVVGAKPIKHMCSHSS